MPIAFPAPPRGYSATLAKNLVKQPWGFVPAPNMGNPSYPFTRDTLNGGMGKIFPKANPRNPGINFANVFQIPVESLPQFLIDARRYLEEDGTLNMAISGVTRDSTGAVLGSADVHVFRTNDYSFVAETTSDANGVWSLPMLKGGPFFLVVYKTGSPDVAGTTVNTLVPVQV